MPSTFLTLLEPSRLMLLAMVLCRTSGLVMVAPVFGSSDVPMKLRAFFALLLTLMIVSVRFYQRVPEPTAMIDFAVYLAAEVAIGLVLGLGVWMYLLAFQLAGQIVSQSAGMSLADVFVPGLDTSVPIVSQLLHLFATVVFLAIGGHRLLIAAFLNTFEVLPPGAGLAVDGVPAMLTTMLAESFEFGIRVAAPGITALLLATLVLGLVSRTLPQLNIMAFGFGMNAMLALGVLAMTFGAAAWSLEEQIESVVDTVRDGLTPQSQPDA